MKYVLTLLVVPLIYYDDARLKAFKGMNLVEGQGGDDEGPPANLGL